MSTGAVISATASDSGKPKEKNRGQERRRGASEIKENSKGGVAKYTSSWISLGHAHTISIGSCYDRYRGLVTGHTLRTLLIGEDEADRLQFVKVTLGAF